jgi:hypothetical protein
MEDLSVLTDTWDVQWWPRVYQQETQLFERMMRHSRNQHRRGLHYRKLLAVRVRVKRLALSRVATRLQQDPGSIHKVVLDLGGLLESIEAASL